MRTIASTNRRDNEDIETVYTNANKLLQPDNRVKTGDIMLTNHFDCAQGRELCLHARSTRYTPSFIREIEAINRLLTC